MGLRNIKVRYDSTGNVFSSDAGRVASIDKDDPILFFQECDHCRCCFQRPVLFLVCPIEDEGFTFRLVEL